MVSSVRGTRCSRRDFIRWAGTVQTLFSRSISSQAARRASPDRTAVCTRNLKLSLTTGEAVDSSIWAMASGTSWGGRAR